MPTSRRTAKWDGAARGTARAKGRESTPRLNVNAGNAPNAEGGEAPAASPTRPGAGVVTHTPAGAGSASPAAPERADRGGALQRAWSDVAADASRTRSREAFRVAPHAVTMHTDPTIVPEKPRDSGGLFELVGPIARRALELGLAAREPSFHLFVSAEPEVMIEDDVVRYAQRFAQSRPAPHDIVYVHDFDRPATPWPIQLPAGVGPILVETMKQTIDKLREEMPSIAQADEVRKASADLAGQLEAHNKQAVTALESTARSLGFGIRAVQGGVQTFPILHGKPVSAEQFDVLDESTKRALAEAETQLTSEVERAARLVKMASASFEKAREEAFSRAASTLIDTAMKALLDAFTPYGPDVVKYLERVQQALKDDWEDLVDVRGNHASPGDDDDDEDSSRDPEHATRLSRFQANLFVANDPDASPPVLYETNPTYPNLFGYLERRAKYGALLTDFTRVRAGALHKASGGVLVVRAADLLADPIIWERMKRVLRERQIGAEDPLGPLGLYATSLRPVPVPIRVRVVLVGSPELYATLLQADADFAALFRVKVEVEPSIPRTKEHLVALDAYLMQMAREREWGTFDRPARARLLDYATRLAGERDRVALSLSPLEETAAFASALAAVRDSGGRTEEEDESETSPRFRASIAPPAQSVVGVEDIETAWRERRERAGAAERHLRELTLRGEVSLETSGARVGVVNGLSVYSAGDVEFGQPMRITAVVALGREGLVDVEHEAQLGGAIHTKGVVIVRGYLSRMFGQERPLSLRAQIAFEQSYGEVDGDSASSSELFAVISALSEVGIDQGIAVTGSVNQLGEIQAIGGVCAKIEGFFDLCAARGLSGGQGVLLPRSNLPHLVLREDVAKAIAQGRFHLYAVDTVSQGIEILTGIPAGDRDAAGRFPAASVYGRVERRLIEIAERLREAEGHGHPREPHEGREGDASTTDLGDAGDFRGPR
jgi:predicted ATP-dependent protease